MQIEFYSKHYNKKKGSAFSGIINSMLPLDVLNQSSTNDTSKDEENFEYDEFGFRSEIDEANGNSLNGSNHDLEKFVNISLGSNMSPKVKNLLTSEPFIEDSKHKLKWIAYLGIFYS